MATHRSLLSGRIWFSSSSSCSSFGSATVLISSQQCEELESDLHGWVVFSFCSPVTNFYGRPTFLSSGPLSCKFLLCSFFFAFTIPSKHPFFLSWHGSNSVALFYKAFFCLCYVTIKIKTWPSPFIFYSYVTKHFKTKFNKFQKFI